MLPLTVALLVGGSVFPWGPVTDLRTTSTIQRTTAWVACDQHTHHDTHRHTHMYRVTSTFSPPGHHVWCCLLSFPERLFFLRSLNSSATYQTTRFWHTFAQQPRSTCLSRVFPSTLRPPALKPIWILCNLPTSPTCVVFWVYVTGLAQDIESVLSYISCLDSVGLSWIHNLSSPLIKRDQDLICPVWGLRCLCLRSARQRLQAQISR